MMNTTIQTEVSAPAAPQAHAPATVKARGGYGFAAATQAVRAALQWRLLTLWAVVLLIPTAVATLPMWQLLSASFDHSVHAAELAARLDLTTVADLTVASTRVGAGIGNGNLLALVLTLLLSPLLSGMTLHAARAPATPGFAALVAGGAQEYPRLLRMLLWGVIPLGVTAGLCALVIGAAHSYGEKAVLESSADNAGMAAMIIAALLFAIGDASLDAGRAMLANDRRRTSAFKAWWQGFKLLVRRPVSVLSSYLGITLLGVVLAAVLAIARLNVPALGVGGFIGAFVLTQLVVLVLAWMRSARLFAMLALVRAST
jgi:hypothetical protein